MFFIFRFTYQVLVSTAQTKLNMYERYTEYNLICMRIWAYSDITEK